MASLNKIAPNSPSRQNPSELEVSLANALTDLETNTPDLKGALRPLQFVSAREVRILDTCLSALFAVDSGWTWICNVKRTIAVYGGCEYRERKNGGPKLNGRDG